MKFRKVMSALLAGAMVLSMSATAFATNTIGDLDTLNEGTQIEIEGTTQTATIKVIVPTQADIVLNPYGLDYNIEGVTQPVQDQLISAPQHIKNESNLPIKVSTKVTASISGATLVNAQVADNETAKEVHLEFGLKAVDDDSATVLPNDADSKPVTADTPAEWKDGDAISLAKGGTATGTCLIFGFTGDATSNPTEAWTAEDIITATIAFTFALDNSGAGGGSGSTSHNITEGTHVDGSGDISTVTFKVGGTATTTAAKDDTVTIEVAATTGKTITASVNNGSAISLSENSGTYTGTFTMPDADAQVVITVA